MAKRQAKEVSATAADKRTGAREQASVEIVVRGSSHEFAGQTVDVSRTGALVWITDEKFVAPQDAANMVVFSEAVATELGDAMTIEFGGGAFERECDVIRVTRKSRDDKSPMLVACRFTSPLTPDNWTVLGMTPPPAVPAEKPNASVDAMTHQVTPTTSPLPKQERRTHPRVDQILYLRVTGDYGEYSAFALNASASGALLTITDEQFAPPAEPEQLVRFTKKLGFQFRSGMIINFLDGNVSKDADVVRLAEQMQDGELQVSIGVRFRSPLTNDECALLNLSAESDDFLGLNEVVTEAIQLRPVEETAAEKPILALMHQAAQLQASDLHIKVGSPPRMRVQGELMELSSDIISAAQADSMALDLMTPSHAAVLHEQHDVEFAYNIDGAGRFRVAAFRQRGYTGLAIRTIPTHVPTIEELALPQITKILASRPRGLVLVTGPTGSGKSHTLAAMVDFVNQTRACHILTMEDPIEFLHEDVRAHITQREIGRDCPDFSIALKRALRQDPDVMLVGELRDLESISLALTAAETGHLVFATLHTTSAVNTPDRIIDVFPPGQQQQIRQQLADTLQGIFAQILVPGRDASLVMAHEVVVATEAVRALVREGKTPQIRNMVTTGGREGMISLEQSLSDLVQRGVVAAEVALAKANFPKELSLSAPGRRRSPRNPSA